MGGKTLIVDLDFRSGLRVAVYRGDVGRIMAMLTTEAVRSMPQFAGDALLVALAGDASGADVLARDCVARLEDRCWDGDAELAEELRCALGAPATVGLTPVPVQVDQLIDLLQGGEYQIGGRLNVRTGEVLPEIGYTDLIASGPLDEEDGDEAPDDDEDWISVDALGTRESYRDMQRFVATHVPPPIAERLSDRYPATVDGRHPWSAHSHSRRSAARVMPGRVRPHDRTSSAFAAHRSLASCAHSRSP